ncbi:MAG: hypothetical protein ABSA39_18235 [Edaphobacter sp.]
MKDGDRLHPLESIPLDVPEFDRTPQCAAIIAALREERIAGLQLRLGLRQVIARSHGIAGSANMIQPAINQRYPTLLQLSGITLDLRNDWPGRRESKKPQQREATKPSGLGPRVHVNPPVWLREVEEPAANCADTGANKVYARGLSSCKEIYPRASADLNGGLSRTEAILDGKARPRSLSARSPKLA